LLTRRDDFFRAQYGKKSSILEVNYVHFVHNKCIVTSTHLQFSAAVGFGLGFQTKELSMWITHRKTVSDEVQWPRQRLVNRLRSGEW
jgi:hypothetical protein